MEKDIGYIFYLGQQLIILLFVLVFIFSFMSFFMALGDWDCVLTKYAIYEIIASSKRSLFIYFFFKFQTLFIVNEQNIHISERIIMFVTLVKRTSCKLIVEQ